MALTVYTMEQAEVWDNIVRSFARYDVYYLSDYVKAFQLHGDGEPMLFYYEDEVLRGMNVVMKRDIAEDPHFQDQLPKETYYDFATPYGYGGWQFEGEKSPDIVFAAYDQWCAEHGIVCEFVRFLLSSNSRAFYPGQVIQRTNNVVRSLECSLEEMRMDFEHKVRKNLKKAESAGLEICVDLQGTHLQEFLRIYYGTMDRNDAKESYYFNEEFFAQIGRMQGNFVYFHVLLHGTVISTELVLLGSDTMYSYLGGTDGAYFAYRPNDFLKYEIIRWGMEHGYKNFVLGGGYGKDDGIFRYKKSFAPHGIVPFYTGQNVFDHEIYQKLVTLRKECAETDFFPQYRA